MTCYECKKLKKSKTYKHKGGKTTFYYICGFWRRPISKEYFNRFPAKCGGFEGECKNA